MLDFVGKAKERAAVGAVAIKEKTQPAVDRAKNAVGHAAVKVDRAIEETATYIDEHPSMIYAGLVGLAIAMRSNDTMLLREIQKINEKLDES